MEDIRVVRGPPYSPEIVISAVSTEFPVLDCRRLPARQWLRNVAMRTVSFRLHLRPIVEGIYQCMGVIQGQPETDFIGESASDLYLLVQGIYMYIEKLDLEITSTFLFQLSTPPKLTSLQTRQYLSWVKMR